MTKSTFIAVIIIIVLIVSTVGILQLVSPHVRNDSEELHNFVTSAKIIHDKLGNTTLLKDIPTLIEMTRQGRSENKSAVESMIHNGALFAKGYKEQYYWIQPTSDSLDLYNSLIREGQLIGNCYAKLNQSWILRQSEDNSNWEEQLKEIEILYDEILSLRNQNSEELNRLLQ